MSNMSHRVMNKLWSSMIKGKIILLIDQAKTPQRKSKSKFHRYFRKHCYHFGWVAQLFRALSPYTNMAGDPWSGHMPEATNECRVEQQTNLNLYPTPPLSISLNKPISLSLFLSPLPLSLQNCYHWIMYWVLKADLPQLKILILLNPT